MAKKRAFPRDDVKRKMEDYHGSCQYVRTSPDCDSPRLSDTGGTLIYAGVRKSWAIARWPYNVRP